jgi:hypothetical protein
MRMIFWLDLFASHEEDVGARSNQVRKTYLEKFVHIEKTWTLKNNLWSAIWQVGGPSWTVEYGRRDSTTANLTLANLDLPSALISGPQLIRNFASKGFNLQQLVALSGASYWSFPICMNWSHVFASPEMTHNFFSWDFPLRHAHRWTHNWFRTLCTNCTKSLWAIYWWP